MVVPGGRTARSPSFNTHMYEEDPPCSRSLCMSLPCQESFSDERHVADGFLLKIS